METLGRDRSVGRLDECIRSLLSGWLTDRQDWLGYWLCYLLNCLHDQHGRRWGQYPDRQLLHASKQQLYYILEVQVSCLVELLYFGADRHGVCLLILLQELFFLSVDGVDGFSLRTGAQCLDPSVELPVLPSFLADVIS